MTTQRSNRITYLNFNQSYNSISVGTQTGYKLYSIDESINHLESLVELESKNADNIHIFERQFDSRLVAMVTSEEPCKLKLCDLKTDTVIKTLFYPSNIVAVRLNRKILVVCCANTLHIHDVNTSHEMYKISDTPPNMAGLCALSINLNCYLAYPGSSTTGEVQIFDPLRLEHKITISAHNSPLTVFEFNPPGNRIATASTNGNAIRVFNVDDGRKLYQFYRGSTRYVHIGCLSFSPDSMYLCCTSRTDTVHIFMLGDPQPLQQQKSGLQTWMEYVASYLPVSLPSMPDFITHERAFGNAYLPFQGLKTVCTIVKRWGGLYVLVASFNGYLYIYRFHGIRDGICQLIKKHRHSTRRTTNEILQQSWKNWNKIPTSKLYPKDVHIAIHFGTAILFSFIHELIPPI